MNEKSALFISFAIMFSISLIILTPATLVSAKIGHLNIKIFHGGSGVLHLCFKSKGYSKPCADPNLEKYQNPFILTQPVENPNSGHSFSICYQIKSTDIKGCEGYKLSGGSEQTIELDVPSQTGGQSSSVQGGGQNLPLPGGEDQSSPVDKSVAASSSQKGPVTWKVFNDKNGLFTMKYPSNWNPISRGDETNRIEITFEYADTKARLARLTIIRFDAPSSYQSSREAADHQLALNQNDSSVSIQRQVQCNDLSINGISGCDFVSISGPQNIPDKALEVDAVDSKGTEYSAFYLTSPRLFDHFYPVIKQMIESFKVTGDTTGVQGGVSEPAATGNNLLTSSGGNMTEPTSGNISTYGGGQNLPLPPSLEKSVTTSSTQKGPVTWKIFNGKEGLFTVRYPSNWNPLSRGDEVNTIDVTFEYADTKARLARLTIIRYDAPSSFQSSREVADYWLAHHQNDSSVSIQRQVQCNDLSINGISGCDLVSVLGRQDSPTKELEVHAVDSKGTEYLAAYTTSSRLFDYFYPVAKQMIESFKVTSDATTSQIGINAPSVNESALPAGNSSVPSVNDNIGYNVSVTNYTGETAGNVSVLNDNSSFVAANESLNNDDINTLLSNASAIEMEANSTGDYTEAIRAYERVLNIAPDNLEALLAISDNYDSEGNGVVANSYRLKTLPVYDKLLSIDPNNPVTLNDKANVLYNMGNYSEGIRYYDKALKFDPTDVNILTNAAQDVALMGKLDDAMSYYNKALQFDPKNRDIYMAIASMFEDNGKPSEAIKYYDKLLQIYPNDALAQTSKADLLSTSSNRTSDVSDSFNNNTTDLMSTQTGNTASTSNTKSVSISEGSSSPTNGKWYTPPFVKISSGTTVTWKNDDSTYHTVTSGNPASAYPGIDFDSKLLPPGNTFTTTFNTTSNFDYYCTLHPFMTGRVIVN